MFECYGGFDGMKVLILLMTVMTVIMCVFGIYTSARNIVLELNKRQEKNSQEVLAMEEVAEQNESEVVTYEVSGDVVMGDKYEYTTEVSEPAQVSVVDTKYETIGKYSVTALAIIMLGAYLITKAVLKHNRDTQLSA